MILFKPEHVAPILEGRKTQTRRMWKRCRVKVGGVHQCLTRLFGAPFAIVRILAVRQEGLEAISDEDVRREGYETRGAYLLTFARINRLAEADPLVWVVDFALVDPPDRPAPGEGT